MPRNSDYAVALYKTMLDLIVLNDRSSPDRSLGSLERMLVAFAAADATARGAPMNASEISKRLRIPRTTVLRHLKALVEAGELTPIYTGYATYYRTNLDYLDRIFIPDAIEQARLIVNDAATFFAAQPLSGPTRSVLRSSQRELR